MFFASWNPQSKPFFACVVRWPSRYHRRIRRRAVSTVNRWLLSTRNQLRGDIRLLLLQVILLLSVTHAQYIPVETGRNPIHLRNVDTFFAVKINPLKQWIQWFIKGAVCNNLHVLVIFESFFCCQCVNRLYHNLRNETFPDTLWVD